MELERTSVRYDASTQHAHCPLLTVDVEHTLTIERQEEKAEEEEARRSSKMWEDKLMTLSSERGWEREFKERGKEKEISGRQEGSAEGKGPNHNLATILIYSLRGEGRKK